MRSLIIGLLFALVLGSVLLGSGWHARAAEPVPLFDGRTFAGWEGDTVTTWRIHEGAIVGGSLDQTIPRNNFLCTTRAYENFELRLTYQLIGTEGFINGGIQIRSHRVPNDQEMVGYQADLGAGFDGALYDESRRNRVLAGPSEELRATLGLARAWQDYRIRCEGKHIQLWLNGVQTVDYTEEDPAIPTRGIIGLQIHGGAKAIVRFKDVMLEELP